MATTVYPIHVHCDEEWWQHTPYTHGEQLWFNSANMDTKFLSRNTVTWWPVAGGPPHCTHLTLPTAFPQEPYHTLWLGQQNMWRCLWHTPKISQKFSRECKIWYVVLWLKRNPQWVSSSCGSLILQHPVSRRWVSSSCGSIILHHPVSRHLAYIFLGRLWRDIPQCIPSCLPILRRPPRNPGRLTHMN